MDITQFLANLDQHPIILIMLVFGWDDALIMLALFIISATITALTAKAPPKSEAAKPAAITDFDFPQIDDGTSQTVVFGDVWLTGWQVVWYGNLRSVGIPAKTSGGGKK